MSSLKIEERFSIQAPIERVWQFLLDPEQIAPCLPGAELLEVESERTFHGQMMVKVGPVTVAYKGTIELTEVDAGERRVQMVGKGKEKGGAGSARMTMDSRLEVQDDGAVAVVVVSDVQLAGRIVRFGRGMIQSVSAQLFKQFAGNVRESLESEDPGPAAGAEPPDEPGRAAGEAAGSPGAGAEPPERAEEPGASEEPGPAAAGQDEPAAGATVAPEAAAGGRALAPRKAEPVRILPLVFRALWDAIAGLLRRLLGRGR